MELSLVKQSDDVNQEALEEFIQHRKEMKKPMTPLAVTKACNVLKQYPLEHQQYMVDQAIMNGWRGIFPVNPPRQQNTRSSTLQNDLTDTSWAD